MGTKQKQERRTILAIRYRRRDGRWVLYADGKKPVLEGANKRQLTPAAARAAAAKRPARLDIYGIDGNLQTSYQYE